MLINIPIKDHINELKQRIIYIILVFCINIILCFNYIDELIYLISRPIDTIHINNFIYTSITEMFSTYINVVLYISIYFILFSIIINILLFLIQGLYKYEIKLIINNLIIAICLVIINNLVFYIFIMPIIYSYFIKLEQTKQTMLYSLLLLAKINEYVNNYLFIIFIISICSLFPLLILMILKLNIINIKNLNNKRNYIYIYIILIISLITPPDIISMILISIFVIIIYEFIILIYYFKDIEKYFKKIKPN